VAVTVTQLGRELARIADCPPGDVVTTWAVALAVDVGGALGVMIHTRRQGLRLAP
jgi:hypothetical protein